jgi:4-hydroxybenzoate polyprenyltransferase
MFTSVRSLHGDFAFRVPDPHVLWRPASRQPPVSSTGTLIVKETIRINPSGEQVSCPRNNRYFAAIKMSRQQGGPSRNGGRGSISESTPPERRTPNETVYCSWWEKIDVSREPGQANWIQSMLISIYLLELVGAMAITLLGCVACTILKIDWSRSAPLWFAGYLLVYNADRLFLDPADRLNTPLRSSWGAKLRRGRVVLVCLSAGILGAWPPITGRSWLLFPLAVAFGILCFYSRPIPGARFRLKDLPYLKSLLAPATIAIVLVPWPAWESGNVSRQKEWLVFFWIFLILTINALVFDYRDIAGDRVTGTKTIPAFLGHRRTRELLMLLTGALVLISIALWWLRLVGPLMPVVLASGCAVLLRSLRSQVHPTLLSVLADILLFLPAVGVLRS